ncbi:hypothetical protein Ddc_02888 [Ditylenchus destructor]|nr:hypothetical protein Ddc_02888 [Ditylenchus destructor]
MTKGPPPSYPPPSTNESTPNRIFLDGNLAEEIPQPPAMHFQQTVEHQQHLDNANHIRTNVNPPSSSPNTASTFNSGSVPPEYHQIYPPGVPNLPPLPGSVPDMPATTTANGHPLLYIHQPIYTPFMQPQSFSCYVPGSAEYHQQFVYSNGARLGEHDMYGGTPYGNAHGLYPSMGEYHQHNSEYFVHRPMQPSNPNAAGEAVFHYISPVELKHRRRLSYVSFVLFCILAIVFLFIFLKMHSDISRRFFN